MDHITTVTTIAVIQARVGSTRLPGKVMYSLDGKPVLEHVIKRVSHTESVDNIVVATSVNDQDDVIETYAREFGADVIRGSELDVQSRFREVLKSYNPEIIVRVTADCPLLLPEFIDYSIEQLKTTNADYASAAMNRTFPRGTTCETFTASSFQQVARQSSEQRHREHVTPFYRENPNTFELYNIQSSEIFEQSQYTNRTDLRLTLDEPADYRLLETVYRQVDYSTILDVCEAIQHIDENNLADINQEVEQKTVK